MGRLQVSREYTGFQMGDKRFFLFTQSAASIRSFTGKLKWRQLPVNAKFLPKSRYLHLLFFGINLYLLFNGFACGYFVVFSVYVDCLKMCRGVDGASGFVVGLVVS